MFLEANRALAVSFSNAARMKYMVARQHPNLLLVPLVEEMRAAAIALALVTLKATQTQVFVATRISADLLSNEAAG